MMFHGHNILVSERRNAFEAEARAARQAGLARQARANRQVTATARPTPRSVPSWWQSVRVRWQLAKLERAVAAADERTPVRDYADSL